mmetsp:Transcript_28042/g.47994  ORF Transcript_28042/g.47994 Transcript_28042/m.47994 type:complete len:293 (+) Transcript_28042:106-984(+)
MHRQVIFGEIVCGRQNICQDTVSDQTARRGVQQIQHHLFHGIFLRARDMVVPAVCLDGVSHRLLLAGLLGSRTNAIRRIRDDYVEITFRQRTGVGHGRGCLARCTSVGRVLQSNVSIKHMIVHANQLRHRQAIRLEVLKDVSLLGGLLVSFVFLRSGFGHTNVHLLCVFSAFHSVSCTRSIARSSADGFVGKLILRDGASVHFSPQHARVNITAGTECTKVCQRDQNRRRAHKGIVRQHTGRNTGDIGQNQCERIVQRSGAQIDALLQVVDADHFFHATLGDKTAKVRWYIG